VRYSSIAKQPGHRLKGETPRRAFNVRRNIIQLRCQLHSVDRLTGLQPAYQSIHDRHVRDEQLSDLIVCHIVSPSAMQDDHLLHFAGGLQKQVFDFMLMLDLGLNDRPQAFNGSIPQERSLCSAQGFFALLYPLRSRHANPHQLRRARLKEDGAI
jgi:hypothetical protein